MDEGIVSNDDIRPIVAMCINKIRAKVRLQV